MTRARRTLPALIGLALALAAPAAGQECPLPRDLDAQGAQPAAAVRYLAHDALGGRLAGSPQERCAADYVAAEMARIGLSPAGEDGGWFQEVELATTLNPHAPRGTGRNVLGRIPGAHPSLGEEVVVVGAHLDHLGAGAFGSLAPEGAGRVHNGADDNASGVGALLAAAERLVAGPAPARTILFLAFTGEEFGLLGSAHFVAEPTVPLERVRAMLNLDMVGRLEGHPLIVYGVGTAEEWPALVEAKAALAGLAVDMVPDGYGPSDHTSFYRMDIPVLHLFTNTHADYHAPGDDAERIDYAGLERVSVVVAELAAELAAAERRLTLVRGAGRPPRPAGGGGYGAYLGSIPDFTPVERGVKLSGVRDGSPAEEAGLRAGDIVVGFGDMEIADLMALTEALRRHEPGQMVEITLLRDGEEIRTRATLRSRQ